MNYRSSSVMAIRVVTACICLMLLCMSARGQDVGSDGGGRRELVPAMFVFGDSLIDNGNNNNLPSFAKANYFPYGIDFAGGPTGRFSNGYTIVDEIGELLSFLFFSFFFFFFFLCHDYACLSYFIPLLGKTKVISFLFLFLG